jgi:hypothetical protein
MRKPRQWKREQKKPTEYLTTATDPGSSWPALFFDSNSSKRLIDEIQSVGQAHLRNSM